MGLIFAAPLFFSQLKKDNNILNDRQTMDRRSLSINYTFKVIVNAFKINKQVYTSLLCAMQLHRAALKLHFLV